MFHVLPRKSSVYSSDHQLMSLSHSCSVCVCGGNHQIKAQTFFIQKQNVGYNVAIPQYLFFCVNIG